MPSGKFNWAAVAEPPSPQAFVGLVHICPLPTTVVIMPETASTRRILLSVASAMKIFPEPSTATASGRFKSALIAAPPSPQASPESAHFTRLPATGLITPAPTSTLPTPQQPHAPINI